MSALAHLLGKKGSTSGSEIGERFDAIASVKNVGEIFWGAATFLLFLALGPFACVAAVFGVFSLCKNQAAGGPEPLVR
jgi:hypothetical protein